MEKLEEKHKEEVMQLNSLEDKLTSIIGKIGDSELMEAFNKWQEQRNLRNSVYNEWLAEILKISIVVGQGKQLFCEDCSGKIDKLDAYCKHCGEVIC